MDSLFAEDLRPGMRLDSSLHLSSGEIVLYRRQIVDEILTEALKRAGISQVWLCDGDREVEELILNSGLRPTALDEFRNNTILAWGLYGANGCKLLSAGRRLLPHRLHALLASGVEVAYEPASDAAPRLARKRRAIARKLVPRRGWSHDRVRSLIPNMPEMAGLPTESSDFSVGIANPTLCYAYLASDVEDLMGQIGMGLVLDVPRAVEAARSAVEALFVTPHRMVIDAIGTLSTGKLRDHTTASALVATAVGRAMGLAQDDCLDVTVAALLHDMAMLWIREDLIAEQGPLGEAGRRAVRRHPARAFHTLVDADGLAPTTALTALAVHERSDGSGYPMGLRGSEIVVTARLLAAVDVLCAVLAPRPHRGKLGGRAAMELCVRMAGEGALDGDAVRALLRAVGLYPLGSLVWLSTGELARVVATNGDQFERPVVTVVRTSSGLRPSEERLIDLGKLAGISITGAADDG